MSINGIAENARVFRLRVEPFRSDSAEVGGWSASIGEELGKMAVQEFLRLRQFDAELGDSSIPSNEPDLILIAGVIRMGRTGSGPEGGSARTTISESKFNKTRQMWIQWQLVDPIRRYTVKWGLARSTVIGPSLPPGEQFSSSNPKFASSGIGMAVGQAIGNLVSDVNAVLKPGLGRHTGYWPPDETRPSPTPAPVIPVAPPSRGSIAGEILAAGTNDRVLINLGSDAGIKKGDKVELLTPESTPKGFLSVAEVQKDLSICTYSGSEKVQINWQVRWEKQP